MLKVTGMPRMRRLNATARRGLMSATIIASVACSEAREPTAPVTAKLTLVSGENQTVSLAASPTAQLPEPVVVYLEENGVPVVFGDIRAYIWMDGAPGANGPHHSFTGADGKATMILDASRFAAGFSITIEYFRCKGFFSCTPSEILATVSTRGTVVP